MASPRKSAAVKQESSGNASTEALPKRDPPEHSVNADWYVREKQMYLEAFIYQLRAESKELDKNHPLVKEVNDRASILRAAFLNDKYFESLDISLPENFEVVVLVNPLDMAFICPEKPDLMFVTTGHLSFVKNKKLFDTVLAHEQGHAIYTAIDEKRKLENGPIQERFGQAIWRDPFVKALQQQSPVSTSGVLFSKREELWCDTYGSFPILEAVGTSPNYVRKLNSKYLAVPSNTSVSFSEGLFRAVSSALTSHPTDALRVWCSAELASRLSYPTSLLQELDSENESTNSLSIAGLEDLKTAEQEIVDFLYNKTKIIDWFLLTCAQSDDFIPVGDRKSIDGKLLENVSHSDRFTLVGVMQLLARFEPHEHFQVRSALVEDSRSISNDEKKVNAALTHFDRFEKEPIRTSSESKGIAYVDHLSYQILKNSSLSNLEKACLFKSTADNETDIPREYLAQSKEELMAVKAPILGFSSEALAQEVLSCCQKRGFKLAEYDFGAKNKHVISHTSLKYHRVNLLELKNHFDESGNEAIATTVSVYVERSLEQLINKRKIKDIQEIISILTAIRENCKGSPFDAATIGNESKLFYFAMRAARQLSKSSEDFAQNVEAIANAGFHPGLSYGDYFTSGGIGKNILSEASKNSADSYFFGIDGTPTEGMLYICTTWPQLADSMLKEKLRSTNERIDKEKILSFLSEPVAPAWRNSARHKNLHDETILVINSEDPYEIATTIKPEVPLNSADELMQYLTARPNLFSPELWGRLTQAVVKNFNDVEKLARFIDITHSPRDPGRMPWREKNYFEASLEVVAKGIIRCHELGALDFASSLEIERCLDLINKYPRCSKRNESLAIVLSYLDENVGFPKEMIDRCIQGIETEPASEMLKEAVLEMQSNANLKLLQLESLLSRSIHGHMSARDFEAMSSREEEESADKSKKDEIVFEEDVTRDADKFSVEAEKVREKYGNFVPDDHLAVVFVGKGTTTYLASFMRSLRENANNTQLASILTLTALRYEVLGYIKEKKPPPQNSLRIYSKAIQFAEEAGERALTLTRTKNPLSNDLFNQFSTENDFNKHIETVVQVFQAVPTPLRDKWILCAIEEYESQVGMLPLQTLEDLQTKLYLPENWQNLGIKIWNRWRGNSSNLEKADPLKVIDYFERILPFYSLPRNNALQDLRFSLVSYEKEIARRIDSLRWIPGLPTPIPAVPVLTADIVSELQVNLLSAFEDIDTVHFLLFSYGLSAEPWHKEYIEYMLGANLNDLSEYNRRMDPTARRAFIHKMFSGHEGLFVRDNREALKYMAEKIGASIAEAFSVDEKRKELIIEVSKDLVYRAGLPVPIRTEILCTFIDWISEDSKGKSQVEREAELIVRLFKAAGAPGMRLLQGLRSEPGVFSDDHSRYISEVQDDTGYGQAVMPFHVAEASGISNPVFGKGVGAGCKAEVHEILFANGVELENVYLKCDRPDGMFGLANLRSPVVAIAKTLGAHGLNWSPKTIDYAIESCVRESKELGNEARRTGPIMASVVSHALKGEAVSKNGNIEISFRLPSEDVDRTVVMPCHVPLGNNENVFCFGISKLGDNFEPVSRSERLRGTETLENYLLAKKIPLSVLADTACTVFVEGFLQGTLWKDLHRGNLGTLSNKSEETKIGLLDFGSVTEQFPEEWHDWTLNFLTDIITLPLNGDLKPIRNGLLVAALQSEESATVTPQKVEQLMESIQATYRDLNQKIESGAEISNIFLELGKIVEYVYNEWPLPSPLRDFCEGARRVFREWGQHTSLETRKALTAKVFKVLEERFSAIPENRFANFNFSIFDPASPDSDYKNASSEADLSWLREVGEFPDETIIWYRTVLESGEKSEWASKIMLGKHEFNQRWIRCVDNTSIRISKEKIGYFEVQSDEGVKRIKFEDLFPLLEH